MKTIDLRSDTVTRPCAAMRAAWAAAEVGDDVYGEDPSVNRLEALVAEMTGTEAALFVPSGTQANLLALLAHCQRGDEYIAGQQAHNYKYEGGGAAVLAGIQPQPIEFEADGSLNLAKVAAVIKPRDPHFARTRLLSLENTQAGKALTIEYLQQAGEFARQHQLGLHLDGARAFNAAVYHGVSIAQIARLFDTLSLCLSKGLGAPVGSVLCGRKELLVQARRWRKVVGGGMRQAGILAAAGIFALQNNIDRLEADHRAAADLAAGLVACDQLQVRREENQTNMLFIEIRNDRTDDLRRFLKQRNIIIGEGPIVRLVTHLDILPEDIDRVVTSFTDYFSRSTRQPQ